MAGSKTKKGGATLTFAVWQFVRVMVRLEKVGLRSPAYRAWQDEWRRLDRRLGHLGQRKPGELARVMSGEEIVVRDVSPAQAADVLRALNHVIRQMNDTLQRDEADDESLAAIRRERDALVELREAVRRVAPRPAPARPSGSPRPRRHPRTRPS